MNADEAFERRSCAGKVPYKSRSEAKNILNRMAKQGKMGCGGNQKKPYACPYCGFFHNGTLTPYTKRVMRQVRAERRAQEEESGFDSFTTSPADEDER